jgi:hypothetical protein
VRGLLATVGILVLIAAIFLLFAGGFPVGVAVMLVVAIGSMALATLLLWTVRSTDDPEARLARRVEMDATRRLRLGAHLESRDLIDAKERGEPILDQRDERAIKLLIELIRLGDRVIAKDAVDELGSIGPEARPWVEAALPLVGKDAQVDLRLALQAIQMGVEEEHALPLVRVFE